MSREACEVELDEGESNVTPAPWGVSSHSLSPVARWLRTVLVNSVELRDDRITGVNKTSITGTLEGDNP